jgi:hypothetical protein
MFMEDVEIVLIIDIIWSEYLNKLIDAETPDDGAGFAIEAIVCLFSEGEKIGVDEEEVLFFADLDLIKN